MNAPWWATACLLFYYRPLLGFHRRNQVTQLELKVPRASFAAAAAAAAATAVVDGVPMTTGGSRSLSLSLSLSVHSSRSSRSDLFSGVHGHTTPTDRYTHTHTHTAVQIGLNAAYRRGRCAVLFLFAPLFFFFFFFSRASSRFGSAQMGSDLSFLSNEQPRPTVARPVRAPSRTPSTTFLPSCCTGFLPFCLPRFTQRHVECPQWPLPYNTNSYRFWSCRDPLQCVQ